MKNDKYLHTLRVFLKAGYAVNNVLKSDMEKNNINPTEFMVLEVLKNKEKMPVNDIAKKINITSGSMTYVSNKLLEKGLIERQKCTKDSRLFYLSLSDKGKQLIEKAFGKHCKFIEKLFVDFEEEDFDNFVKLSKKIGFKAEELK